MVRSLLRLFRVGIVVFLLVLLGTLQYASSATGTQTQSISVVQTTTQTTAYCLYQTQFLVTKVQVSPEAAQAGMQLQVVFKVEYADGSPARLDPELADFLVLSPDYSHIYQRVPVTPTGTPGEYSTSIALPSDIPIGTYKLYCVHCTLTDGLGNFAPNSDTASDETAIITDRSIFSVGPSTVTTATAATTAAPPGLLSPSLLAGLVILVLIIALLVALFLRRGKKKTS